MRATGLAQVVLDTSEKLQQPRIYLVVARDTAWGAPDTSVERWNHGGYSGVVRETTRDRGVASWIVSPARIHMSESWFPVCPSVTAPGDKALKEMIMRSCTWALIQYDQCSCYLPEFLASLINRNRSEVIQKKFQQGLIGAPAAASRNENK